MRRVLGLFVLAALSLHAVSPSFAAPPAPDAPAAAVDGADDDGAATGFAGGGARAGRGGGRGGMMVVLRIAEELHLSDEQTIKVAGEFRRVAQQRRELVGRKNALAAKLEAQLAQQPRDDKALDALTDQMVAIEQQLLQLPEQLWKGVQPVLTAEQRARLILLRGKMKQQLESARRRRLGAGAGAAD
jgi:Spy/CpxP family protein refolding chaperone